MKKVFAIIFSVLIVLSCSFGVVCSAERYLTGLRLTTESSYDSAVLSLPLPKTFEASLYFPLTQRGKGGVIIGNYTDEASPSFNFEIADKGVPCLYIIGNDKDSTIYNITFPEVSVYTGELLHLAVTADFEKGEFACFIDGELKQTVQKDTLSSFDMNSSLRFGGDFSTGNKKYFKGVLQTLQVLQERFYRTTSVIHTESSPVTARILTFGRLTPLPHR